MEQELLNRKITTDQLTGFYLMTKEEFHTKLESFIDIDKFGWFLIGKYPDRSMEIIMALENEKYRHLFCLAYCVYSNVYFRESLVEFINYDKILINEVNKILINIENVLRS